MSDISCIWFWKTLCLFWVALAIFQLSGGCHQYRRQNCKFRPMPCSSEGFFYVPYILWHGISVFKVISERPVILTSCHALGEGAITTYIKCLAFDEASMHVLLGVKREHYTTWLLLLNERKVNTIIQENSD